MLSIQERAPETIQNPGADTKILFNDSTDGLLKTKDSSGVVETLATTEGIAATEPKVYVTLVTEQSGTDAPAVMVLKNTLGGEIVWSYVAIGQYRGTLVGAFPQNKTVVLHNNPFQVYADEVFIKVVRVNDDDIGISVLDSALAEVNGIANLSIKIEVYP